MYSKEGTPVAYEGKKILGICHWINCLHPLMPCLVCEWFDSKVFISEDLIII